MTLPSLTDLRGLLRPFNQDHLLRWWEDLSPQERQQLGQEIQSLDLELVCSLYAAPDQVQTPDAADNTLEQRARSAQPPRQVVRLGDSDPQRVAAEEARRVGADQLQAGRVAAILVAGGQGTRLGFDHPKGMFPIGPISEHSLFRLAAEQLLARQRRYSTRIPYYIMTSRDTHNETVEYFEQQGFFGLEPQDVLFFTQASLPALDATTGQILLQDRHRLCLCPDGHGGLLQALTAAEVWQDMHNRGIEHLFYHQVDNPLVRICDPEFLGFHVLNNSQASTKVVAKRDPLERMGAVVDLGNQTTIIEYSDLPETLADRCDSQDQPVFWAGNTAVHVFDRGFLEHIAADPKRLPFHRACKQVPHLAADGQPRHAGDLAEPNAVKFERFIFDVLAQAETALVVEADRQQEFSPVKNADGADSPATARAALLARDAAWIRSTGCRLLDGAEVEISPLYALEPEDVVGQLFPGMQLGGRVYLNAVPEAD